MRIALVSTPFTTTRMPPLSLALIAARLKREGHAVACFDLNLELFRRSGRTDLFKYAAGPVWKDRASYERLLRDDLAPWLPRLLYELTLYAPDLVGISAWHAPFAELIAGNAKAAGPRVAVIAGGPLCSRRFGPLSLRPSPHIDAVVSGEGELALCVLARQWEHGGALHPLSGVSVYAGDHVAEGGAEVPIADLDDLPDADFTEFDLDRYDDADFGGGVALPLLHTRGCPRGCAFCMDQPMWGAPVRSRSPGRTAAEVRAQFERHGVRHFVLLDLCANPTDRALVDLALALRDLRLPVDFCAQARFSPGLDGPAVALLREAGFVHLTFGLESGAPAVLERMRKAFTLETASANLRLLDQHGILASANLIAGFPGETPADVEATLAFVRDHAPLLWSAPSVATCSAPPASDLARDPGAYGLTLDPRDPEAHETWIGPDGAGLAGRRATRDRMAAAFADLAFKKGRSK